MRSGSLPSVGREVEQPRPNHASVPPQLGDLAHVELEIALVHELEALAVGLHHGVLDSVVDHLDEVPGPRQADVRVAVVGASVAKMGSSRSKICGSHPTIRQ